MLSPAQLHQRSRPWYTWDALLDAPAVGFEGAQAAIGRNLQQVQQSGVSLGCQGGGGHGSESGGKCLAALGEDPSLQGAPVLLGETGIPMDMDRGADRVPRAFRTGDFSSAITALDSNFQYL